MAECWDVGSDKVEKNVRPRETIQWIVGKHPQKPDYLIVIGMVYFALRFIY